MPKMPREFVKPEAENLDQYMDLEAGVHINYTVLLEDVEIGARSLYADWQATDVELSTSWEDAGDRVRQVFMKKAYIVLATLAKSNKLG